MCENNAKSADVQVKEKYYYTEAFQNYWHFFNSFSLNILEFRNAPSMLNKMLFRLIFESLLLFKLILQFSKCCKRYDAQTHFLHK
jgi:hypothetical protein